MPRTATSSAAPAFRNRGTRLTVFGIVALLAGCGCGLLGLLQVVILLAAGSLPATESLAADPRAAFMGLLLYCLLGAAFVWAGIGSIRKRRWVRPVMLILAWTWLLGGLVGLLVTPGMLDGTLNAYGPGAEMPGGALVLVKMMVLGVMGIFGVLLSAAFVWAYHDRDLLRTCEARDPQPAWTERCPTSVLGLSLGLGAMAALAPPMALRAVVPLFGWLVTGPTGAVLLLLGGAACAWLARETYLLRMRGWWGSLLLLLLLGVSTMVTLGRVEPVELYHEMGYNEAQVEMLRQGGIADGPVVFWLTAGFALLTLVYMAAIRKHFAGYANNEST